MMTVRIAPGDHQNPDGHTPAAALPALAGDAAPDRVHDVHLVVRVQSGIGRIHQAHVALAVESALAAHDPAGFVVLDVRTIDEIEAPNLPVVELEPVATVRPLTTGKRRAGKSGRANTSRRTSAGSAAPDRIFIRLPFEVGP